MLRKSQLKDPVQKSAPPEASVPEVREIFVRAHTVVANKEPRERPSPPKWPDEVIVLDTESTRDTAQKLNFGAYRRCKPGPVGYQCVEEGLFYTGDLSERDVQVLRRYVDDPRNLPGTEVKKFPPQTRLHLYSRSEFVGRVFWKYVREGAMVVGFNLPFDLSRLAVQASPSDDGGWSLVLSLRRSRKTGEL